MLAIEQLAIAEVIFHGHLETTLFNRDNQCFPDSHPL